MYYKKLVLTNQSEQVTKYSKTREGFRAFCKDLDQHLDDAFYEKYSGVFQAVKNIPCHADFFRYIQWHNLAFITAWDMSLPTMLIHYENYTNNFNQTKDTLLKFLEQDAVHEPPHFESGKVYRDYFTAEEITAVSRMFLSLALEKTWYHTKHYLDQSVVSASIKAQDIRATSLD